MIKIAFSILKEKWLWVVMTIALIVRSIIAWAPLEWIMSHGVLTDDTFYYFTIARNFAHGFGITFDKLTATNGFHPLWLLAITPIFIVVSSKYLAVHFVLFLSAIIDTASIYFFYRIFKELKLSTRAAFITCLIYALSPMVLFPGYGGGSMNGLETSLNVFLILIYVLTYLKIDYHKPVPLRSFLLLGVISGFVFLTRTDNAILLLATWLILLFRQWLFINIKMLLKFLLGGLSAIVIAAPWLIWSYTKFGSIIQVSGTAVSFWTNELSTNNWTILNYLIQYIKNIGIALIYIPGLIIWENFSTKFLIIAAISGIFLITIFRAFFIGKDFVYKKSLTEKWARWLPFGLFSILFILVDTFRTGYLRSWYNFSVAPFFMILAAILLDSLFYLYDNQLKKKFLGISIGAIIFIFTIIAYSFINIKAFTARADALADVYRATETIDQILPKSERVGVWNAGVISYFLDKNQVVNLDGLVNNEAFKYILTHSQGTYVRENHITYIVDGAVFLKIMSPYWGIKNLNDIRDVIDVVKVLKWGENNGGIVVGRLR